MNLSSPADHPRRRNTIRCPRVQNCWQGCRKLYCTRRCRLQLIIQPLETTQGVLKPARLRLLAVPNFDPICMCRTRNIAQRSQDSSWSKGESPLLQGFVVALVLFCLDLGGCVLNYGRKDDNRLVADTNYSCDQCGGPLQ